MTRNPENWLGIELAGGRYKINANLGRSTRTKRGGYRINSLRSGLHPLVSMFNYCAHVTYSIILAVDRILDMFRTTTNVLSDSCGSVVVARLEGESLERMGEPADEEEE